MIAARRRMHSQKPFGMHGIDLTARFLKWHAPIRLVQIENANFLSSERLQRLSESFTQLGRCMVPRLDRIDSVESVKLSPTTNVQ